MNHPSYFHFCWIDQANAIGGRNEKAVQEFLEKNWTSGLSESDAIRLTIKALLEVVDSGSKNMEICVTTKTDANSALPTTRTLTEEDLQAVISDIEREQEEAKRGADTTMDT